MMVVKSELVDRTPTLKRVGHYSRLRCRAVLGCALLTGATACDDNDESALLPNQPGGSGGMAAGGAAGAVTSGGGAGGVAGAPSPADGGAPEDREVFRPEERAATPELIRSLAVPSGFRLNVYAEELGHARMLATHGAFVYLTRPMQGDVVRLSDADADGVAEASEPIASGLPLVHGITFRGDQVYLATDKRVLSGSVDASGNFGPLAALISDLPDGGQHPYRTLGIGPDDQLYISVGSSCDACQENNPEHATLLVAALNGASRSVFARGLRNTIGFGWHPQTDELWGMDHGSDWRGNDLPPEELNRIEQGDDYGWPYCYGDRQIDPVIQDPPMGTKAEYCAATSAPVLVTQAHNAPIGLAFYTGTSFPSEYQGDAFVAMRGSWNRFPPTGYKVVRLTFEDGVPTGFEDFVTGFLIEEGAATFGRPAGLTVAPDGAVLFTDDTNGIVYRVSPSDTEAGDAGAPPLDAGDAG
jgi:glucose/arabinose dehydrogenase